MKVKKFCATATLLAAACAMQAGALAAEVPAATGTATQSTVGAAVASATQTASTERCADKLGRLAAEEDLRCGQDHLAG